MIEIVSVLTGGLITLGICLFSRIKLSSRPSETGTYSVTFFTSLKKRVCQNVVGHYHLEENPSFLAVQLKTGEILVMNLRWYQKYEISREFLKIKKEEIERDSRNKVQIRNP